jgi:membrane dipeptidase
MCHDRPLRGSIFLLGIVRTPARRNMRAARIVPGAFDFGLSTEEEARALHLHRDSIIVDLLSQHAGGAIFDSYDEDLREQFRLELRDDSKGLNGLPRAIYWPYEQSRLGRSDLIREWLVASGLTCGTYGIDVHDGSDPVLNEWERLVQRYADLPWLRYVTTSREIRDAKARGLVAFYAHCQPTTPVPCDPTAFDRAYRLGLRSFMLTYNRADNIGAGCTAEVDVGLTPFGLQVLRHCNDLGIMVDVSHCGRSTSLDACRYSRKAVNANHTAAKALHNHARCKSDEELLAIAQTGGVIGVVAVPSFLTADTEPTIDRMLDHVDYIADLVGYRHVAIGTDWPLQAPDDILIGTLGAGATALGFRKEDALDLTRRLVGFEDCRDLPNITRGLVKRGYGDEEIRGILGENAMRVFENVCG